MWVLLNISKYVGTIQLLNKICHNFIAIKYLKLKCMKNEMYKNIFLYIFDILLVCFLSFDQRLKNHSKMPEIT